MHAHVIPPRAGTTLRSFVRSFVRSSTCTACAARAARVPDRQDERDIECSDYLEVLIWFAKKDVHVPIACEGVEGLQKCLLACEWSVTDDHLSVSLRLHRIHPLSDIHAEVKKIGSPLL